MLHIRIIAISCGHAVHAPVPGLLVLRSLSDSAPLLSSVSVPYVSCLYAFSCCCRPLLCNFSLLLIVLGGLLITLGICIIYDKAYRIIFGSNAVLCERYSGGAKLHSIENCASCRLCMERLLAQVFEIFLQIPYRGAI